MRELSLCVCQVMSRHAYWPRNKRPAQDFVRQVEERRLTRGELDRGFARRVYEETRSYKETGQRLGVSFRTVKKLLGEAPAGKGARVGG